MSQVTPLLNFHLLLFYLKSETHPATKKVINNVNVILKKCFFLSFKSTPLPKRFVFTVMDKWVLFFRISLALVSWTFSKFCPLTSKICKEKMKENSSLFCINFHSFQAACMLRDQPPFYTSFWFSMNKQKTKNYDKWWLNGDDPWKS